MRNPFQSRTDAPCGAEFSARLRIACGNSPCSAASDMFFNHVAKVMQRKYRLVDIVLCKKIHRVIKNGSVEQRNEGFRFRAGQRPQTLAVPACHYNSFHKNNTAFRLKLRYYCMNL